MASFDIKSLYTNVPLIETIYIIINLVLNNNNSTFNKLNKSQFKKLLEMCLFDTYFIFDSCPLLR